MMQEMLNLLTFVKENREAIDRYNGVLKITETLNTDKSKPLSSQLQSAVHLMIQRQ